MVCQPTALVSVIVSRHSHLTMYEPGAVQALLQDQAEANLHKTTFRLSFSIGFRASPASVFVSDSVDV